MLFKPRKLGSASLSREELERDKKACRKIGPCGLGEKALYVNSFYISRHYYVPLSSVTRVFKRIAMTRGGFTGKGVFVTMPLLVVEYDGGLQKQCNFKREEQVDQLLAAVEKQCPDIKVLSKTAETWKSRREAAAKAKQERIEHAAPETAEKMRELDRAAAFLEEKPELYQELSLASKARRVYERSNPAYKWVALVITLMGVVAAVYGAASLIMHRGGFSLQFLLFGLAAIFFFAGAHVLPTARNNKKAIERRLKNAQDAMASYIEGYTDFPAPAIYAHPVTLRWMKDMLLDEHAGDFKTALLDVKKKLQSLNADVSVEQEVYDDVMQIKPMFLVNDYK